MFRLNANLAVYLHRGAIDFRENINGLSVIVEHELRLDPFAHAAFAFGNRRKDRIKILGWSRNGFWLLQKRLENARFVWPREDTSVIEITVQQLHWLAAASWCMAWWRIAPRLRVHFAAPESAS